MKSTIFMHCSQQIYQVKYILVLYTKLKKFLTEHQIQCELSHINEVALSGNIKEVTSRTLLMIQKYSWQSASKKKR